MTKFQDILQGGDLRSIGKANEIIALVRSQADFDDLFIGLTNADRRVVMRTADAIEKISIQSPDLLKKHKTELVHLCQTARDIELKWHLALIISRINLTKKELDNIWQTLTKWATDKKESKIVRVNSIQGLSNLLQQKPGSVQDFNLILTEIENDGIPSINARIKKLRNARR